MRTENCKSVEDDDGMEEVDVVAKVKIVVGIGKVVIYRDVDGTTSSVSTVDVGRSSELAALLPVSYKVV